MQERFDLNPLPLLEEKRTNTNDAMYSHKFLHVQKIIQIAFIRLC